MIFDTLSATQYDNYPTASFNKLYYVNTSFCTHGHQWTLFKKSILFSFLPIKINKLSQPLRSKPGMLKSKSTISYSKLLQLSFSKNTINGGTHQSNKLLENAQTSQLGNTSQEPQNPQN
jgi:hypothetical protein